MIEVEILPTVRVVQESDLSGKIAIVIDVLRATSVLCTAMHNGAKGFEAVRTPEEAFALRDRLGADNVILGGEREADKIDGFDVGNSPSEYTPEVVGGKTVVLTTTNGTEALVACCGASRVMIASLLNYAAAARAAVDTALAEGLCVAIVCSGTLGKFSIEDAVCAGLIAKEIEGRVGVSYSNDGAVGIRMIVESGQQKALEMIAHGSHYQKLMSKGYGADIIACLECNVFDEVFWVGSGQG